MVHPVAMLRWLYLGRVILAFGVFTGVVLVWESTPQSDTLIATLALLAAIAFNGFSLWYTSVLKRPVGTNFLYAQVIFDALLVTAIVHITGGIESSFPPAYILVIAAGALLLPFSGGMLVAALASMLYFADLIWFHVPALAGAPTVRLILWPVPAQLASALAQIGLFATVAVVVGALGDRLRRTGHALGEVESELRQLRLETDDILSAIDTPLVTIDDRGRLMYMNSAAEAVLGFPSNDWLAQEVLAELDQRAPGLGNVIRRTSMTKQPVRRYEIRMRRNGTEERVLGVRTTLLERPGAPWVTAVFQDITDSRQIEDLLRRTERLQAVAELGASLAHEIKNPLASIRSATEQLDAAHLTENDRNVLRRLVITEADRVSRLLTEFMEFSRVEVRRRSEVDISKVTADAIRLVEQHPDARGGATIDYTPPRDAVTIDGDPDLLHRAVFNLVLNAVQHSGDGGRVRVELAPVARREIPASLPTASVRLQVSDTGPGIPKEELQRIFDPFFTTREGGTGLGLAMVHRAIEAHQGTILVDGQEGRGAQFTVYLPSQAGRRSS